MMKKILICGLALVMLLSATACAKLSPDAVAEKIVENIREDKAEETVAPEDKPEETPVDTSIEVEPQLDGANYVIIRSDDGIDTGIYEYENGLNTKISYYNNVTKELSGYEIFVYDANGNVTEWTAYTADGEFEEQLLYEYDEQNRMVKKTDLYDVDKLWNVNTYQYNEEGLMFEQRVYDDETLMDLSQTLLHTYDEKGHLVRTDCYDDEGDFIFATHFVCDAMGNVIHEETYFDSNPDEAQYAEDYTYVYNEHEQIIEENGTEYQYGPMP